MMHTQAFHNTIFRCLLFLLTCCSTPEQPIQVRSTIKHQTSHIYNLPIGQLRDTIIAAFKIDSQINSKLLNSVFHYRFPETNDENTLHQIYLTAETKEDALFSKEYFQSGNKNDIYLHTFGETWDSSVYYVDDKPLEFRCDFAIKLASIDGERTKATIEAQHPQVINGTVGIGPHGSIAREVAVKPTTVEESALPQYLAMELHDNSKIK